MINYVVVTIEYLFKKVFVFNIIAFGAFARVYTSYYLYLPLFVKYIPCDLLMFRGKNKKIRVASIRLQKPEKSLVVC